ncbi:uncharacterized protein LOC115583862 isoform X2 [Sparus aurata]|uniref:uncharacterized protein LOC115583862 isoform X2 n=1 Tax=Sparus aurata TaxID=8175 RepID=UPI0011C1C334|nr:uncharacterized protein LOC115583862 isoform X2 [Sparus aurata]
MSGHDADEDSENKDEVRATLSVQWSDDDKLQKKRSTLQKVLQTLVSKIKFNGNCDVLNVSEDGRAEIRIKPAAALFELQQMSAQLLKGKDGKTVTIMSVSLKPPEPDRPTPLNASEKILSSPVSEPQNVDRQLGEQRNDITSFTCDIPMLHYWYVNHAYKREIERIEKESGGKIMAEMKLTFEPHQKDGNPNFAFSEFTNLVQKCSAESRGFTFPLGEVNPEGLKDTIKIIQRPENKLWIALSSEDMTVLGPRESQNAIRKSLNAAQKTVTITHTPAGRFTQTSQKTSLKTAFGSEHPSTSHDQCAENEDEVQVLLSVKWSADVQPQKRKMELQKLLQTWDNNHDRARNKAKEYTVLNVLEDGRAVIKIKPPPAVSELQKLSGQTLKGKDGKTVMISSISLTLPELGIKTPDNASMNFPSSVSEPQHPTENASVNLPSSSVSEQQHDQELLVKQNGSSSSAAVSTREKTCVLPVVHFWYMSHIFKEDIKRFEREHGVKMNAEVNVTFVGNQKDEGLKEAHSAFIDLLQKRLSDFYGSVTLLKSLDTEEFQDALKMIQRPEHKLLVALSSEEMTIYGPRPISTAISKSLNAAQTSSANTYNSAAKSQVTSLKKFGVDSKDSGIHQGKVNVTSSKNVIQHQGATRFSVSTQQSSCVYPSEGASSGPVVNIQSGYSTCNTEAKEKGQHQFAMGNSFYPAQNNLPYPNTSAGQFLQTNPSANMPTVSSSAVDNEDEECPMCKDTFINKKQLKCKHEFCEECLEQSKKHMGPVCPVCKDVFGVIEGTQPDGTMSSYKRTPSLPGFEDCGTIVIDYYIPSGKQTERHPNPGQRYHGTSRTAYLPDNKEGKEVLRLLRRAFNQKLIFTVGTSTTTGIENQVTWNDIHHKTSRTGGPQRFGYPDPDYLRRVRDELMAKGIE